MENQTNPTPDQDWDALVEKLTRRVHVVQASETAGWLEAQRYRLAWLSARRRARYAVDALRADLVDAGIFCDDADLDA